MAESFNLLKRVSSFDTSPEMNAYSGVLIFAGVDENGKDITYTAGSMDGNVLQISNEWGSQAQADNIWENIQQSRFAYQPYTARGAMLDPSAEIGDGVTISDVYSGIFARATTYGSLIRSDISAPTNEEIEHEFTIQAPTQRQYTRFTKQVRSQLVITATQIAAEVEERRQQGEELRSSIVQTASAIRAEVVSKSSDNGYNTFGWNLTANNWNVYSGSVGNSVLRVSPSGLEVAGTIRAGHIGGTSGFVITATSIYNNKPSLWSSQSNGVYIGTDGIALGNNFRVDSSGSVTANNGTFTGAITCTSLTVNGNVISPADVSSGLTGGWNYNSSGWGNYIASTVAGGSNYGYTFNNACKSESGAVNSFYAKNLYGSYVYAGNLYVSGSKYSRLALYDSANGRYVYVLGRTS